MRQSGRFNADKVDNLMAHLPRRCVEREYATEGQALSAQARDLEGIGRRPCRARDGRTRRQDAAAILGIAMGWPQRQESQHHPQVQHQDADALSERRIAVHAGLVERPGAGRELHRPAELLFYIGSRDETFDDLPPGFVLHAYSIRHAIENGFTTYDFLCGNEPYKYSFGAQDHHTRCIVLSTRSGVRRALSSPVPGASRVILRS
jgi:hypothetical protein